MRLGGDHMGGAERRQRRRAVDDALDFEAEHDEAAHDLFNGRLGLEMRLQPGERRLHRTTPPRSAAQENPLPGGERAGCGAAAPKEAAPAAQLPLTLTLSPEGRGD